MTDYRKIYKNEIGACASCANVRSVRNITGKVVLVEYDGGKHAACQHCMCDAIKCITMRDELDSNFPINECWEPRK